jgi:hypothetical protein
MSKGFIFGAAAFALVYTLEAEWNKLQRDIGQVDWMRSMSDEIPLVREQVSRLTGLAGWLLTSQSPAVAGVTRGLAQSLREDLVRYAKLDAM